MGILYLTMRQLLIILHLIHFYFYPILRLFCHFFFLNTHLYDMHFYFHFFLSFLGLLNRFLWMQEFYPLLGEEILLFKTSISFVDHLQEFLGAILSACTLVIPPFNELKQNPFHVIDYLKVNLHIVVYLS